MPNERPAFAFRSSNSRAKSPPSKSVEHEKVPDLIKKEQAIQDHIELEIKNMKRIAIVSKIAYGKTKVFFHVSLVCLIDWIESLQNKCG